MPGKKLIVLLAVAAMLLAAIPSLAAEISPDTYRTEVEPICKKNAEANETILKGVRKNVKTGELKKASRQLFAAAKALKRTREELLKVPKPAEDAARLTKWLKGFKTEVELLEAAGTKLAKEEKNAALKMVLRLESNAKRTNNLVLDYEFRYCRYQPGKFL
ncbi:MAG TPA: hypothetical protein VNN15_05275 [Solirubrobacterales bacterium]|nr:hypothetical protein [Solirubrobacterales bacterium]